ncbi:endo-1,4-beta-xylanase [Pleomorphovibrio marinus]|uniref:endo-1,4-beta-xylanase n=1 Tax=Pleomorphovibrio marinus TaxID=2164132 RepID=UPI000E0A2E62|nr:endo-1,4-beta-xylanase [Pleomorphovibrio marinus]
MTNRRNFIRNITSLAASVIFLPYCKASDKERSGVMEGEEWKDDKGKRLNGTGTYVLTEDLEKTTQDSIEKHRMGDFIIRLCDADDQPLIGVDALIELIEHEFDWGISSAGSICDTNPKAVLQAAHIRELFNCTTAKCYWDEGWHQPIEKIEGKRIRDKFVDEINWGLANGLRVKGHPLVWTVRKAIPTWMDKYSYSEQMRFLEEHVRDLIRTGGHGVGQWDLCNEMLWEPSLRNLSERNWPHIETIDEILTYLEPAVHWAKEENPYAIYALNDYGLVKTNAPGVTSAQQRQRYVALIKEMRRRGCAPDALGTQCHVAGWYTAEEFVQMLDELSEAGLPIQVTEFWAKLKDYPFDKDPDGEHAEGDLIRYVTMIYTLAFAHPQVSHFTYWGGGDWFDGYGEPNQLYHAIRQLIRNEWFTKKTITSNSEGELKIKAFYGNYWISLRDKQGNHYSQTIHLAKGSGGVVKVNLPIHR